MKTMSAGIPSSLRHFQNLTRRYASTVSKDERQVPYLFVLSIQILMAMGHIPADPFSSVQLRGIPHDGELSFYVHRPGPEADAAHPQDPFQRSDPIVKRLDGCLSFLLFRTKIEMAPPATRKTDGWKRSLVVKSSKLNPKPKQVQNPRPWRSFPRIHALDHVRDLRTFPARGHGIPRGTEREQRKERNAFVFPFFFSCDATRVRYALEGFFFFFRPHVFSFELSVGFFFSSLSLSLVGVG